MPTSSISSTRCRPRSRKPRTCRRSEITDAASKLLVDGNDNKLPSFIAERLSKLDSMISMVNDQGFALPEEDRQRVLACLTYFANPTDIIPDNVPVLGFLDDAIMIELVVRELQHEVEAYDDFVAYRNEEARLRGVDPSTLKTERVEWAEARRVELLNRMKSRRLSSYSGCEQLASVAVQVRRLKPLSQRMSTKPPRGGFVVFRHQKSAAALVAAPLIALMSELNSTKNATMHEHDARRSAGC